MCQVLRHVEVSACDCASVSSTPLPTGSKCQKGSTAWFSIQILCIIMSLLSR